MRVVKHWRPSPATVLASIALFVSLGGVSYGLATGSIDSREIKDNTITSRDLRNNRVTGVDIRRGGVFGSDVHNSSLAGADVKNNSMTGTDILESSLGPVPNAQTLQGFAASAFVPASKFVSTGSAKKLSRGQTGVVVAKSGPFTITADCTDAGGGQTRVTVQATSTETNSNMDGTQGASMTIDTTDNTGFEVSSASVELAAPSGATLDFTAQYGVNAIGADCYVAGFGFS
jgi:hypothetical protein